VRHLHHLHLDVELLEVKVMAWVPVRRVKCRCCKTICNNFSVVAVVNLVLAWALLAE
jgi:hypothetical protein